MFLPHLLVYSAPYKRDFLHVADERRLLDTDVHAAVASNVASITIPASKTLQILFRSGFFMWLVFRRSFTAALEAKSAIIAAREISMRDKQRPGRRM